MCKIIEDYANEVEKERDLVKIRVLFDNDGSLELAMKMFPSILEKDIQKIYEEVMAEKENV